MNQQLSVNGNPPPDTQIISQNPFDLLISTKNGGSVENLSQDETDISDWVQATNNRKKKRFSTGNGERHDINTFDKLSTDDKLSAMFATMSDIGQKVDQCLHLSHKVHGLENQMSEHHSRLTLLEYKSLDLEARSRRNNLIFGGLPEIKDEDCHSTIANFLSEHLGIDQCPTMPRVHRLGRYKKGSNRPIIAFFLDSRDTEYVVSRAKMLKGTNFNINRDFPKEIASARKLLWPKYKFLRNEYPESVISIAYPAKLIKDGKVVANVFPNWDYIMQSDRIPINRPAFTNPVFTNTVPKTVNPCDARDTHATGDNVNKPVSNVQGNTTRSNDTTGNSHPHRSRRESTSPRPSRGQRGHAPSRQRPSSVHSTQNASSGDRVFIRPWDNNTRPNLNNVDNSR
jgi:hypothetical protein